MCKKKKIVFFVAIGVFLVGAAAIIIAAQSTPLKSTACVTVNGVIITNEEIDLAYTQQQGGITPVTREQVVDATVRNTVVRHYGRQIGLEVTQEELDTLLADYHHTGYYEDAVALYGKDGLRQGLYNHTLFVRTKEHIITKVLSPTTVTEGDVHAFLDKNGLAHMSLTDKQRADVLSTLTKTKQEEAYNAFVDQLLAKADIIYT